MILSTNLPNPVLNKILLVRSFISKRGLWPEDLKGACGVASFLLVKLLPPGLAQIVAGTFRDDRHYFSHKVSIWVDHVWVHIGDTLVDITVAQFNGFRQTMLLIVPRSPGGSGQRYRVGSMGAPVLRHMERLQRHIDDMDLLREAHEFMGRHEKVRLPLQRRHGRDLFEPSVQRYPYLQDPELQKPMPFQDPPSSEPSAPCDVEQPDSSGIVVWRPSKNHWARMVGFDPKHPPLQKRRSGNAWRP